VDLDDCRDPSTGELSEFSRYVIAKLNTYTEVSPSGTGVKLLMYADLPHGKADHDRGIEVYVSGRYFTVTGLRLSDTPASVQDRSKELSTLYEELFTPLDKTQGGHEITIPTDRELALSALAGLNKQRAVGYEDWIGVGMALHSVASDGAMLKAWDDWSASATAEYQEGLCAKKWETFNGKGTGLGSLIYWAKHDGWKHPSQQLCKGIRSGDKLLGRQQAAKQTPAADNGASVPPPARRVLAPYQPFPVEALPVPLSIFVRQAAEALGCDPAYIALPVLAVAASLIGNSRTIKLKRTWEEPSVIWAAIVGYSGTLKTPGIKKAVSPVYRLQKRLKTQFKADWAAYLIAEQEYKEKKKAAEEAGEDPGDPPVKPVEQRVICSDTTIEKLAEMLEDNPRGLLVARDELAGWIGSFSRYKGKAGASDLPNWLELFNAGTLIVDRKMGQRTHYFVEHAAASIVGGVQPGVLVRALTPEFLDAGLAARLLMVMPPRLPKRWSEAEVGEEVEKAYHACLDKLQALQMNNVKGEKVPHMLCLSAEAKAAWVNFYNQWAQIQAASEGELAAAFSKLEAYGARFSLIHHVVERVARDENDIVRVDHRSIEAGITLTRWFANEVRRIYTTLTETEEDRESRHLIEFIRSRGGKITARQLQRSNSRKYHTSTSAELALQTLESDGLGQWLPPITTTRGGQPARYFELHPTHDTTDTTSEEDDDLPPATADTTPDISADATPETAGKPKQNDGTVGTVMRRMSNQATPVNGNGAQHAGAGTVSSVEVVPAETDEDTEVLCERG
jgi:hypothetical protein